MCVNCDCTCFNALVLIFQDSTDESSGTIDTIQEEFICESQTEIVLSDEISPTLMPFEINLSKTRPTKNRSGIILTDQIPTTSQPLSKRNENRGKSTSGTNSNKSRTADKIIEEQLEPTDDRTSDEDNKYVVSYIETKRIIKNRKKEKITQYKVFWVGCPNFTWEPRKNLEKYFKDILDKIDNGFIYSSSSGRKACGAAPYYSNDSVTYIKSDTISGAFGQMLDQITSKYIQKGEYQCESGFLDINDFPEIKEIKFWSELMGEWTKISSDFINLYPKIIGKNVDRKKDAKKLKKSTNSCNFTFEYNEKARINLRKSLKPDKPTIFMSFCPNGRINSINSPGHCVVGIMELDTDSIQLRVFNPLVKSAAYNAPNYYIRNINKKISSKKLLLSFGNQTSKSKDCFIRCLKFIAAVADGAQYKTICKWEEYL